MISNFRQNPLVQDFVRKLPVGPPSLQEVAGRVIKNNGTFTFYRHTDKDIES